MSRPRRRPVVGFAGKRVGEDVGADDRHALALAGSRGGVVGGVAEKNRGAARPGVGFDLGERSRPDSLGPLNTALLKPRGRAVFDVGGGRVVQEPSAQRTPTAARAIVNRELLFRRVPG
jgi:hypothetical protein